MGQYDVRPCPCGSGKASSWQYDGRSIPLCRTCEDCHDKKMARYSPRVFTYYTENDVDEQIESEEGIY